MAGLPARGPCGLCALYPSRGPGYKPVARQRACSDHDDAYRAPVSGVRLKNPIQTMVVLKTFSRSITDLRPGPAQVVAHGPDGQDGRHDNQELTRSEEHTSELQSLMRISYAVFCLTKKK